MDLIDLIIDMGSTKDATAWLVFCYMKALSRHGTVKISQRDICESLNMTGKTSANCLAVLRRKKLISKVKGMPYVYQILWNDSTSTVE